jgi:putative hydrolase of the HAD superfamily
MPLIILKTLALRMTKAVFFDWFNTLARYDPPRYRLHTQACQEIGIDVSPEAMMRSVPVADKYFFEENSRSLVDRREPEERARVYYHYQDILLAEAGIKVTREQLLQIMNRVQQLFKGVTFALFDDVLVTMKALRERELIMGLLTNAGKELVSVYAKLGLEPYLDFVVTSEEAGEDKPRPAIFRLALQRAGVSAQEAIHVGDQYVIDIVGARGVGIRPVLIDRYDIYPDVADCPRIHGLTQVTDNL